MRKVNERRGRYLCFLTIDPNAEFGAIHAKAMLVILRTSEGGTLAIRTMVRRGEASTAYTRRFASYRWHGVVIIPRLLPAAGSHKRVLAQANMRSRVLMRTAAQRQRGAVERRVSGARRIRYDAGNQRVSAF